MGQSASSGRPTAADRLLAEAVRLYEIASGAPSTAAEGAARQAARNIAGSAEARVVVRAKSLPTAPLLGREIATLRGALRGIALAGFAIAAAAGAATAHTAMAADDSATVNFFWLLASLLGLHVVSLLVWLVLMVAAPRHTRGGILGSAIMSSWRWLSQRFGANRHRLAAAQALGASWGHGRTGRAGRTGRTGRAGRWLVSSISHGLWLGFLLGGLAMALALLSTRFYTFVWQTTILDATAYVGLTGVLAAVPAALGIDVPDTAAVLAAQWPGTSRAGDEVLWSSLLISAIALYGLLPRAIALVVSAVMARRNVARTPLDLGLPYYAQLVPLLSPLVAATKIVDGDAAPTDRPGSPPDLDRLPPPPPAGPVYLLGWEYDEPASGWPPPGTPAQTNDLGRRDARIELEQAIATLQNEKEQVARVVVVTDLRQSPDRGVSAVFAALESAAPGRLVILLTGATAAGRRLAAADAATRISDWVAAGETAGVERARMVAIDLDAPIDTTSARVAQLLGARS